tara:strand:- start:88 stop:594 length:507 start_codon:yes stop_codon:yes gene_type:complete
MLISLIVAMDNERGIGRNNDLMWHLPKDMRFFRETTLDNIVIMGRKNYDSIPLKYRPLDRRENVILSRNKNFKAENCKVYHSLNEAISSYQNETEKTVFIIGGGQIYKEALELDLVSEMYITEVHSAYRADTFFPDFDDSKWEKTFLFEQQKDEKHQSSFSVFRYLKK